MDESAIPDIANLIPLIPALDCDMHPLREGDRVRFIMRGYYLEREQENFGIITAIDRWGGIRIEVSGTYRHFVSSGTVASYSKTIYFCHHVYDRITRSRIYLVESGEHRLFIAKLDIPS